MSLPRQGKVSYTIPLPKRLDHAVHDSSEQKEAYNSMYALHAAINCPPYTKSLITRTPVGLLWPLERMRLRVKHPLVQADRVGRGIEQVEVLQRLR